MKYQQNKKIVEAIYDHGGSNPYLDAMPDLLPREQFLQMVQSYPVLPYNLPELTPEQRRMELLAVQGIFIPLDYSYVVYDNILFFMVFAFLLFNSQIYGSCEVF